MWELADFRFTLKYRPGKVNQDADFLSHRPAEMDKIMKECTEEFKPEDIAAVGEGLEAQSTGNTDWISAITCNKTCLSRIVMTVDSSLLVIFRFRFCVLCFLVF